MNKIVKDSHKNKKIKISIEDAKLITVREKEKMDAFFERHINENKDVITLVLKAHLYIEGLIEDILSSVLVKPEKINRKRFSDKLDIFEAMNLDFFSGNLMNKLRSLNRLRNELAHRLNKNLSESDIQPLMENVKFKKDSSLEKKLACAMRYLVSYLHFVVVANKYFVFVLDCKRNASIFEKDIGYQEKSIFAAYPLLEIKILLMNMKMKVK